MLISPVTLQNGLPPAPNVEILDANGNMPAGNYWFALVMDQDINGAHEYANMNRTGIEAMGPSTMITARDPWTSFHIRDIPLSDTRPIAKIMVSLDGATYYQVAVAPAVEVTGWYDQTVVSGEMQPEGLYGITVQNPAPRLYGDRVGQVVIARETGIGKGEFPDEDDSMQFDHMFDAMLPGRQGAPQPEAPYRQAVMKPSIRPSDIAGGAPTSSIPISPVASGATAPVLRDVPQPALRYIPMPVDAYVGTQEFVWPVEGPNWTSNGVGAPPAPSQTFQIYPNAGQVAAQQAKPVWMNNTALLAIGAVGLGGLLLLTARHSV